MNPYRPFAEAAGAAPAPMLEMVEPENHFDNLDGVTREQLVAAQIAKHKEILTPDAPVNVQLKNEKFFVELKQHDRT